MKVDTLAEDHGFEDIKPYLDQISEVQALLKMFKKSCEGSLDQSAKFDMLQGEVKKLKKALKSFKGTGVRSENEKPVQPFRLNQEDIKTLTTSELQEYLKLL